MRSDLRDKLRHRARFHQRRAHRIANKVMHKTLLAKAHFGLCRMHVGINLSRRRFQEQQYDRKHGGGNDVAICLCQRMLHDTIAHQPLIHEDKDGVSVELLQLRFRDKTMQPHLSRNGRFIVFGPAPRWSFGNSNSLKVTFSSDGDELIEGIASEHLI